MYTVIRNIVIVHLNACDIDQLSHYLFELLSNQLRIMSFQGKKCRNILRKPNLHLPTGLKARPILTLNTSSHFSQSLSFLCRGRKLLNIN